MSIIVCLGDSITEGRGDSLHAGWVGRLNAHLQRRLPCAHTVHNLGISGQRLSEVFARYFSEALPLQPDLVILSVGTNDCQRNGTQVPGAVVTPLDDLMRGWQKWGENLAAAPHKTLIMGPVPVDEKQMPRVRVNKPLKWVLNADLEKYNARLSAFCAEASLPFLDLWDAWKVDAAQNYTYDGLHPNDAGYDAMALALIGFCERRQLI